MPIMLEFIVHPHNFAAPSCGMRDSLYAGEMGRLLSGQRQERKEADLGGDPTQLQRGDLI
jgi:hypothetical protein